MKAQKTILMTAMLGLVFAMSSYASENEAASAAKSELKDHISFLFRQVPWEDVVGEEGCCVQLSFTVNDQLNLEDIQIEGENEDLVHYAKVVLTRNKIKADPVLKGQTYHMKIRFVNKA
jgi:hypothetical protein